MELGIVGFVLVGAVIVAFVTMLLIEHRLPRIQYRAQDIKAMVERIEKRVGCFVELSEYWLELSRKEQADKQRQGPAVTPPGKS